MIINGMAYGAWAMLAWQYLLRMPVSDFHIGWAVGCTILAVGTAFYGRR